MDYIRYLHEAQDSEDDGGCSAGDFISVGWLRASEDVKVKDDETVKSKEKTVTENPDGTVTKKETQKTTAPDKP